VRNFVARNNMRDMAVGDQVIVYHSNAEPSGAVGTATVAKLAYPDPTAFDRRDDHFDPKSNPEKPTWYNVDLRFASAFKRLVSLEELKADAKLDGMMLTSGKYARLSVQPMEKAHFDRIVALGNKKA
jgi:predicted RNA-binding protein with PUA-like domain